jgi:hypothetical protein
MENRAALGITYLTLLRKYKGKILRADPREMRAASLAVPEGVSPMAHLHFSVRNYELECRQTHRHICTNRDGLCEEDKCNCR